MSSSGVQASYGWGNLRVQAEQRSDRYRLGWRVADESPVTVSTAYRWVTTAVLAQYPDWKAPESYALFPVVLRPTDVLMYSLRRNGPPLSRESQEIMVPGDYGLYNIESGPQPRIYSLFRPTRPFSGMENYFKAYVPAFASKTSLTSSLGQQALTRDCQCVFSGVIPSSDSGSDALVPTWIFPPFLGSELSENRTIQRTYQNNPDAWGLSEFMVVENILSGRQDLVNLFWENKLGIDVDDNYRVVVFEVPESLNGSAAPLKSHLTLVDQPHRPSDRFLRLHFLRCLAVSVNEDYAEQEVENFMEELGVFDNEIDPRDPRWSTPLGIEVHAYLIRQKMAKYAEDPEEEVVVYDGIDWNYDPGTPPWADYVFLPALD